jgi:DNA-binding NarL/FixJ family response regulator
MIGSRLDPLVEREAELSALRVAVEQAAVGDGALVVIEGPAGIGKTRLVRAARGLAEADGGFRILAARGAEFEAHMAFGVVRQLLDPIVLALGATERDELFTGAAGLARTVLGGAEVTTEAAGADRYSKINGLFWLISTLARERPLAIVVDDVQWADEPSLEFLGFLARRIEGLPVLLVAAMRPAREAPGHLPMALVAEPTASVLRPAPLSDESVGRFVREAVGSAVDPDFVAACLEATRGNPFLLSELLREVAARRIAPTAEAAWRIGSLAHGGVSAAVELRLARMPEAARPLAEAVAVLGDETSGSAAAGLAGLDPALAGAAESALVRAGILEQRRGLCFTHPLVRSTVLHGMSPTERARLHAAAARLLSARGADPETLATHLLHIEPAAGDETVEHLRAAARRATQLGASGTAAAYLDRALAEPPAPPLRCAVLTELGSAEARAGLARATAHLRQAVEVAPDPAAAARAALELARALKFGGEAVQAVDVLAAVRPVLGSLDPELRELIELEEIGLAYISRGARARLGGRVGAPGDRGGSPTSRLEAFVLAGLAFDSAAAGVRSAVECGALAARAVASDLIPVDPTEGGYGMLIAGVAMMFSGRFGDASAIYARMSAEGRRRGSVVVRSAAASTGALVNWRRGRIREAEADSSLALDMAAESHGTEALVNAARAVKALVAVTRDPSPDELARIEAEVLDTSADPDALPYHLVLHARGVVRVARGDFDGGIVDLLECGRLGLAWGAPNPAVVPWRSDAAVALARAGDRERAKALAAEELELAARFGAPHAIGIAQRAVALVAKDATSLATLEQAVASLSQSGAALDLAVAATDLAAAQRRAGLKSDARKTAARAQELAVACGAAAVARRAREEALATGLRPRRVALKGVDSLTPSELRVAQRAAEGLTNREIAEDLFVTTKTVEMHLANAYAKLGIRSRTQLAEALEPHGASDASLATVS